MELERQIAAFQPPPYQPAPRVVTAVARKPTDGQYHNVRFLQQLTLSQKSENCDDVWCRSTDGRQSYSMTADEIVASVRKKEAAGKDFMIWAGHGSAAFMPLATMERTCKLHRATSTASNSPRWRAWTTRCARWWRRSFSRSPDSANVTAELSRAARELP